MVKNSDFRRKNHKFKRQNHNLDVFILLLNKVRMFINGYFIFYYKNIENVQ